MAGSGPPIRQSSQKEFRMPVFSRVLAATALAATASSLALTAQAETVRGGYHIMPTKSYIEKTGRNPFRAAGEVEYFGGPVFSKVKTVSVMWNKNVSSTTQNEMPAFIKALPNSTYLDQGSQEYSTKGHQGVTGHGSTNQTITRGSYLGQVVLKPKNTSDNLSDEDVQKEIEYQIKKGVLPKNDVNTLYMIFFPSNITITLDGIVSCQDFGAYHFATNDSKITKKNIFYSVEPECGAGFNFLTFAASHEFMEATTDNIPTPGSNPDYPQAWNTSDGYEVADLCGNAGSLKVGKKSYQVTQFYLNSTAQCSTTPTYTSP
jgi:hypothetical protein